MFAFGLPQDWVTWTVMALGCLVLVPWSVRLRPLLKGRFLILGLLCACASGLSFGYFKHYLGGAPRLIDATTYLFQARSLALGSFGMSVFGPSANFRGRFIVSTQSNPEVVAGIFPPGYPSLLSLGVRLGHYEYVGPLLAALLVLATYALAYLVSKRVSVALLAAVLSTLCAALRYHTADTMSHGWSALLTVGAVMCCVRLTQAPQRLRTWTTLGVALGALLSTRQFTGLLVACACALVLIKQAKTAHFFRSALPWLVLSATPGLLLLLAQHRAITGSFFESPQHYYYARADGPPGCFQLGWGSGCHYEHRDAVEMQGGQGLTPLWSLLNTLHRLHWHSLDVANFEPLLALGLWSLWAGRHHSPTRALGIFLGMLPLGYSLFYFNGSYPGGGARFFSELIPLWHVLIARGMVHMGAARWGVAATLLGFGVHAHFSHEQLRSPHFGPPPASFDGALSRPAETHSLVFVSTAHQFNLLAGASPSVAVARNTQDSRLSLVEQQWLGHQAGGGQASAASVRQLDVQNRLSPLPAARPATLRFETESDYPVMQLRGAWVYPEALADACVSMGKALRITRTGGPAHLQLELLGTSKADAAPPITYDVFVMLVNTATGADATRCQRAWVARLTDPQTLLLDLAPWPAATHVDAIDLIPHGP